MPLKRINTGVKLTPDEYIAFKELADKAQITFPADIDKGPIEYPEGPWRELAKLIHTVAIEKGLPDIPGYYGVDAEGQFVTYSDIPDFIQNEINKEGKSEEAKSE